LARFQIRHFVAQHAHGHRLRIRSRRLKAIVPSRRQERWYRNALLVIVGELRAASRQLLEALRATWTRRPTGDALVVGDAEPPDFDALFDRVFGKFDNSGAVARKLATAAAVRNLTDVDEQLVKYVSASVGVNVRDAMTHGGGEIADAMRDAAQTNVDLITSIPEEHRDRLRDLVQDAWANGDTHEQLASEIEKLGGITERRAAAIARDQTSKMNTAFNKVRQTDLGITQGEWQTMEDERVRESHAELDGEIFDLDDPPMIDGRPLLPGEDYNCRCRWRPIVHLDDEVLDEEAA
jgi:SPP1 gp7 family putative phage head morphogenesis protein